MESVALNSGLFLVEFYFYRATLC